MAVASLEPRRELLPPRCLLRFLEEVRLELLLERVRLELLLAVRTPVTGWSQVTVLLSTCQ